MHHPLVNSVEDPHNSMSTAMNENGGSVDDIMITFEDSKLKGIPIDADIQWLCKAFKGARQISISTKAGGCCNIWTNTMLMENKDQGICGSIVL
ncbi:hypothetical protein L2E82_10461 [Cichorium intybus]|uniref:Uncharacterized protein n=1 Tax=Cichorium intybus TaxID=13427 RepID=A0ACB9GAN8_CICIN|nr:hypothetical protein L2E82_10461 [Cichorium intybus]